MNKLISFIDRIKLRFFDSKLPDLKAGDLVWAKRYNTEEEMLEIEEGHREGPYIVIYRDKKKSIMKKTYLFLNLL